MTKETLNARQKPHKAEYGRQRRKVWLRDARRRGRKRAVVEEFLSFLWLLGTTKGLKLAIHKKS